MVMASVSAFALGVCWQPAANDFEPIQNMAPTHEFPIIEFLLIYNYICILHSICIILHRKGMQ